MTGRGRGLSWDGGGGKRTPALLIAITMLATLAAPMAASAEPAGGSIDVIVRETTPTSSTAEHLVTSLGGVVEGHIDLIGGFTAAISPDDLVVLDQSDAIASVTLDSSVQLAGGGWGTSATDLAGLDPYDHPGSLYWITRETAARGFWASGVTGAGVDVALIDSGVNRVTGLSTTGKVIDGADLSLESTATNLRYRDTYGHGTHMAGIIAGRDSGLSGSLTEAAKTSFIGMAPGARIVNVKVGAADGAVDVSQVIAGIDWVVQHRNTNGMNIRVLNLSFGTDSSQSYLLDPLAFAVEQAWKKNIVVVVAAGNDGNGAPLRMPAADPYVVTVGSAQAGDKSYDRLSDFSNCGSSVRKVDLLAPGRSVTSLRVPNAYADVTYPQAAVDGRFFLGSGTSQAAAVISGAAALFAQWNPSLNADDIKAHLRASTKGIKGMSEACAGSGILDLTPFASPGKTPKVGITKQLWTSSTGLGTLEASRGSDHLTHEGVMLSGEKDIFGKPFLTATWAPKAAAGTSWNGGTWNGSTWTGSSWSGGSWSGVSWSGVSWSGVSWSGLSWSGVSWSGLSWSGVSWSGLSWSGVSWSGLSWSGTSWS